MKNSLLKSNNFPKIEKHSTFAQNIKKVFQKINKNNF